MIRIIADVGIITLIFTVATWAAIIFGLVALVHVIRQRSDAFTAVNRLNKPAWVGIIIVSMLVFWFLGAISLIGIIGIVAVGIYMADVRPKVNELQGR